MSSQNVAVAPDITQAPGRTKNKPKRSMPVAPDDSRFIYIGNIAKITGMGERTIRSEIAKARAGESDFPLPITLTTPVGKRVGKLQWSRDGFNAWLKQKEQESMSGI